MTEAPPEVVALAERRAAARAAKDWAASDALRDEIAAAGWLVRDTAGGWTLAAKPPYDVHDRVTDLPDRSAEPDTRPVTVAILAEGWPDDVRRCVDSVLAHTEAYVLVLDAGSGFHDERVETLHLAAHPGWAAARTALLKADTATIHVALDPSLELTGDAVTPVVEAFADPGVVAAGGWGVNVSADWREFADGEPGDVDAILGYLFAVRRAAALATPPHPKARFYRNADMEWSFALREATGGRCVMTAPLPATRHRHRGYHDTEPEYRDRESRRTYERFLQRYRGRDDLRARR
ncbi:MAG TPA: hypothetical protein VFQ85_18435 [Mycobacteriales bacterium]|nr:hypothetical protein [Mycobacteriales bacterium]